MKIDKFNLFFSLILLLLLFIFNNNKNLKSNIFIDYESAVSASKNNNKPLFICFNSSISEQKISDFKKIKEEYIVCILDLEKDKHLFEKYNIKEIPSYMVIDNQNKKICMEQGYKEKNKLFEWLRNLREN